MKALSLSSEDKAHIAAAIISLHDEHGKSGIAMSDIQRRTGFHHRKGKMFMDQYGPNSDDGATYWNPAGRKFVLTDAGQIIFSNLSALPRITPIPEQDLFENLAELFPSTNHENNFRTETMDEFVDDIMAQIEQYCVGTDTKNEGKQSLIRRLINRLTKD